jgi:hypothetical protein
LRYPRHEIDRKIRIASSRAGTYCRISTQETLMTYRLATGTTLLLAVLLASSSLEAHHGAAAFDLAHSMNLRATVTRFHWANPHALLTFSTAAVDGASEEWTAETAGPVILVRAGWTKTALKAGDQVTIVGQPAKNGSRTMLLQRVVFADGRELTSFIPR